MRRQPKHQFSENEILEAYAGVRPPPRRDELYDTDFRNYAKTMSRSNQMGRNDEQPINEPEEDNVEESKMRFVEACRSNNVEEFYVDTVLRSIVNLAEDEQI